jgi:cell division GTPase FtsZ
MNADFEDMKSVMEKAREHASIGYSVQPYGKRDRREKAREEEPGQNDRERLN